MWNLTLHKKWNFPLRVSSINETKSVENCGFDHIYWRNPYGKFHFLCSVNSTFSENITGRPFLYMVKNEFAKSSHMHVMRASVVYVPTCQRAKNVPTSHFYVPTCQRLANFSTWCANVSKGVPIYSTSPAKRRADISTIFQKNFLIFESSNYA